MTIDIRELSPGATTIETVDPGPASAAERADARKTPIAMLAGVNIVGVTAAWQVGMVAALTTAVLLLLRSVVGGRPGLEGGDVVISALVGLVVAVSSAVLGARAARQRWVQSGPPPANYRFASAPVERRPPPRTVGPLAPAVAGDRFDRFDEPARKSLTLALNEAVALNQNYIGTEHLLLGLLDLGDCTAVRVLAEMAVDVATVRRGVEFIIGRGDRPVTGDIGLTPRAKQVIELTIDEAARLGHGEVGTEHLLLGLIREGEGIAANVLSSRRVTLDEAREAVLRLRQ